MYKTFGKRTFDVCFSSLLIIAFSPLFLLLYLILKVEGGEAFYFHERVGLSGSTVNVIKFRSMYLDADKELIKYLEKDELLAKEWKQNHKLSKDPRVTKIGRFLRKSKLDELPQLFNVLRGEMSLVGPRPIVSDEFDKYFSNQKDVINYQSVRPGMTGLWQVSQHKVYRYDDRINLELSYLRKMTLKTDIWVLLMTVSIVFRLFKK